MNQHITFTKMHGLGNCYIYIDLISKSYDIPSYEQLAMDVSNQNTGIGSDGLILILPSKTSDIKMRIFNKDGSEAKNCGNGLRCVAKYAYEHQLVIQPTFSIETLGGPVEASVEVEEDGKVTSVTVDMGIPKLLREEIPMKGEKGVQVINEQIEESDASITCVSMGNPHALFFYKDIDDAPIDYLGKTLADHHPNFPEGVNVGFVQMLTATEMIYRVWERGSGITQACGTGACAAVVASILTGRAAKDQSIKVHLLGGDLDIEWLSDNRVLMKGPAAYICEGTYFL